MRCVRAVSLTLTALRPPSCGGPRYALHWRRIVGSKPAIVSPGPDPMRRAELRTSSAACHLQLPPCVSLAVTASRPLSCGGRRYALS